MACCATAPQLQTLEEWDGQFPNPSTLQLWNRWHEVDRAIVWYHLRGMDAPLQWYDEMELRRVQYYRAEDALP
jgi:hypothetical protein